MALALTSAAPGAAQTPPPIATQIGTHDGEEVGTTTAIVGDVDRDGYAEYLIGVPGARPNGIPFGGSARLYSGRTGALLHSFDGSFPGEQRGWVAALGDVNRDGIPDFALASPLHLETSGDYTHKGSIRVVSGATNQVLYEIVGPVDEALFGLVMAGIGDADGDSIPDFAVGSSLIDATPTGGQGVVYVLSGLDGSVIRRLGGQFAGQRFGFAVAGVGDMNGDGLADVLVGAPALSSSQRASAQIYSPKTGAVLGGLISGQDGDHLGWSVAGVGDVDRDGIPDWMAGAPDRDTGGLTDNGAAYLYSGATGLELYSIEGGATSDHWGAVVARAGYVNGDSIPDFAIGSPYVHVAGVSQPIGAAVVYSGSTALPLFQVGPDPAVVGEGDWIAGGGDVDGDGNGDVIVSAAAYGYTAIEGGMHVQVGRIDIFGYATRPRFVFFDPLPGVCPNLLPTNPGPDVDVLVLGRSDLDVTQIDVQSVRLNGIPASAAGAGVGDEAGHAGGVSDPCECQDTGVDGYPDKRFRLAYADLAPTLAGGRTRTGANVRLAGRLTDGTRIEGVSCFAFPIPHTLISPNPARRAGGAVVAFDVPAGGADVRITLHDVRGRLVRELAHGRMAAGPHSVPWDCRTSSADPVSGGLYFVRTRIGGREISSRLTLIP